MIKKQEKPELGAQRERNDSFLKEIWRQKEREKASLAMGLARKKIKIKRVQSRAVERESIACLLAFVTYQFQDQDQ